MRSGELSNMQNRQMCACEPSRQSEYFEGEVSHDALQLSCNCKDLVISSCNRERPMARLAHFHMYIFGNIT